MSRVNDGYLAVIFAEGVSQREAESTLAEYGLEAMRWLRHDVSAKVAVPPEETQIWIEQLASDDRISSVEQTTRVVKRPDQA